MPSDPSEVIRHAYVISKDANPNYLAYNNWGDDRKTIGEVLRDGAVVTDEIFSTPWDKLTELEKRAVALENKK